MRIYQILKQIRLDNNYNANSVAARLGVSDKQFYAMENGTYEVSVPRLKDWLGQLDIPKADHLWYLQKHQREVLEEQLSKIAPIRQESIHRIADFITFFHLIDPTQVEIEIRKQTIKHVLVRPRSADNAIDRIFDG